MTNFPTVMSQGLIFITSELDKSINQTREDFGDVSLNVSCSADKAPSFKVIGNVSREFKFEHSIWGEHRKSRQIQIKLSSS